MPDHSPKEESLESSPIEATPGDTPAAVDFNSSAELNAPKSTLHEVNSTVLAFHGPLIYEAKVLKVHEANTDWIVNGEGKHETFEENPKFNVEINSSQDSFYLHYQGWNSKWDEWVTDERVLKNDEENRKRKLELAQLAKKNKKKAATPSIEQKKRELQEKINGVDRQGGERKRARGIKKPASTEAVASIPLDFNTELKYVLIDDWEFVTKDKQLVDLPSNYPISKIIKEYSAFRKTKLATEDQNDILDEILQGLELYFNKSLSSILLYKFEKLQYLNLLKSNQISSTKTQAEVYGVEHLLRLLISFPGLLGSSHMDGVSMSVLINELTELIQYISGNVPKYLNKYVNASPQYDSLARS